jgi:integral membrane protein
MLGNPIGRLRIIAMLEGLSFLLLLGVAMPLKYYADMDLAVKIGGWAHGVLFMVFSVALLAAAVVAGWGILRVALIFAASLVPFGPFLIDASLRRDEEKLKDSNASISPE